MTKSEILARLSELYKALTTTLDDEEEAMGWVLEELEDILGITK
jgi:hypothetical protein